MRHVTKPKYKRGGGHRCLNSPRAIGIALLAIGTALLCCGGYLVARDNLDEGRYEEFAETSLFDSPKPITQASDDGNVSQSDSGTQSRDWDSIRTASPDAAAWVKVDGTAIDYPVMEPTTEDGPDFYLTHDAWKRKSAIGAPYIEQGSTTDGTHSLVYGHHCGTTLKMFSQLSDAYKQDRFDRLGDMTWTTPVKGDSTLVPLCSMTVDKTYPTIRKYDFEDESGNLDHSELSSWLRLLCSESTAKASDWEALSNDADKVVTLVTCTSVVPGQPARTVTVFIHRGGDGDGE